MFRSKKAVEPLIATVLLLVVVVGIGAVVTGMIRNMISEQKTTIESKTEQLSCSRDIVLNVLKIDDDPQVCLGSNYVNILLENTGKKIDDFKFIAISEDNIFNNDSISPSSPFLQGQTREFNVTFSGMTMSEVQEVRFIPKIKRVGEAGYNYCSEVAIIQGGLPQC